MNTRHSYYLPTTPEEATDRSSSRKRNSRLSLSSSINSLLPPPPQMLLPISITVRNLFPPLAAADHEVGDVVAKDIAGDDGNDNASIPSSLSSKISSLKVEDRCTLVAADVLLRLRLDIIVIKGGDSAVPEEMLYSSEKLNCTAHPRWDHLDEQLLLSDDDVQYEDLANFLYARFVAIRNDNENTTATVEKDEIILAEISLHPSNLRRLPTTNDENNADSTTTDKGTNMIMTLPESLPPNAILMHYNDGYTRVVPNLYELLVKKGIIAENIMLDPVKSVDKKHGDDFNGVDDDDDDEEEDDKNKSVFDDGAFDVLGTDSSEGAAHAKSPMKNSSSTGGIDDKVFSLLHGTVEEEGQDENSEEAPTENASKNLQEVQDDDETMDTSMLTKGEETDSSDVNNDLIRNEHTSSPVPMTLRPIIDPLPELLPCDADMGKRSTADIDNEIEELRRLVNRER